MAQTPWLMSSRRGCDRVYGTDNGASVMSSMGNEESYLSSGMEPDNVTGLLG